MRRAVEQEWPGVAVREACSAEEALSVLRQERVDILLSDHNMGYMTGVELLEICARDHPETVRVIVTGSGAFEVGLGAINRAHVHAYASKDDGVEGLRSRLRALASS